MKPMDLIKFSPDIPEKHQNKYLKILPRVKSHVIEENYNKDDHLRIRLFIACKDKEQVKKWIHDFSQLTKTTYSIRHSEKCTGRFLILKQILNCRHNSNHTEKIYDGSKKIRTRNTNCPSQITVTLHAVKKRYQSRDERRNQLQKECPCELLINLTHNHSLGSPDMLRFRRVGDEVTKQLIELYRNGHSPSSALQMIKTDILLNSEDPQSKLADRYYCPDYMHCYHVYRKKNWQDCEPPDFKPNRLLEEKINYYNSQSEENNISFISTESGSVMCICPPLFQRVHANVEEASQIVFMDSSRAGDHGTVYSLLTQSDLGGLPLGIIITSSEHVELIQTGLEMLKKILKENIFFGSVKGPKMFVTSDSPVEQIALGKTWPASKVFVGTLHILQTVWRWLVKTTNTIPIEKQLTYFELFKAVLYAETEQECWCNYEIALQQADLENYRKFLEALWEKRQLWALTYKTILLTEMNTTNNVTEAVMRILRDKFFCRIKHFNLAQSLDLIMTKITTFYENRLLDATNDQLGKNIFGKTIQCPPKDIMENINFISEHIALIPSDSEKDLFYIVNMNALHCTCLEGNSPKICKHIEWASGVLFADIFNRTIDSQNKTKLLNILAKEVLPTEWYKSLYKKESVDSGKKMELGNASDQESCPSPFVPMDIEVDPLALSSKERGYKSLEKLSTFFHKFIESNPDETADALEKMSDNADRISTFAAFTSACINFGVDCSR